MLSRLRQLGLPLLLALYLGLAGLYSIAIPPFETPDEIWHFAFIHHLARGGGLPVAEPNTRQLWRQQGVQAPGYYLVAAALTAWIDQSDFPQLYARANPHAAIGRPDAASNHNFLIHHTGEERWPWRQSVLALHLARVLSIACGALTVAATYATLRLFMGDDAAMLGTGMVAFLPQFVFISAAVSNDNAVNALAALTLWRLVALVMQEQRPSARDLSIIGVLLGLAVVSKLSALGLLAVAALVVLLVAWRQRDWRVAAQAAWWVGAPVLAIGGWWYVRNWLLYGDPLAWNIWQANILLRVSPANWRTILGELGSLERSFWGLFGWLNLPYPELVYSFFRALELLIGFGLVVAVARWLAFDRRMDRRWWAAAILLIWLAILTVSWLRFMRIAPAAQGRYFFAAASTLAMLAAIGLRAWRIPTLSALVIACLFALTALTPVWIIRPAYSPPPAGAPAAALTPVVVEFGDQFALTGVSATPTQLLPGGAAEVTLAWQALAPGATDYSIFIQLVDDSGLVVAQVDTMPGGGRLPTSQWAPGETHVESYTVAIPATAYTPNQGRWAVGLYDQRDGRRLPAALVQAPNGERIDVAGDAIRFGAAILAAPPGATPNPVDIAFEDSVTLAGYAVNTRRLKPGDVMEVTLYWRARGAVTGNYTTFVHLLDAAFQTRGGHDGMPEPVSPEWPPDEIVADVHRFTVAEDAPPGQYQLELGLYTRPDFDRLGLLAPARAEGADRLLLGPFQVVE